MKKILKPLPFLILGLFFAGSAFAATVAVQNSQLQPNKISGLQLWVRADSIPGSDGSTVTTWLDESGKGHDMLVGVTAAGPTLETNELNGKPALHFTDTQSMKNTLDLPPTWTVMYVTKRTGDLGRTLQAMGNNWLLGAWGDYVNSAYYDGNIHLNGNAADHEWRLYGGQGNASTSNFYSQGHLIATSSTAVSQPLVGLAINDGVFLGEPSDSYVAEIIAYDRPISERERLRLEKYFKNKYALDIQSEDVPKKTVIGASPTGGLVGYWKLEANDLADGIARDSSGNGRNGTITGTSSITVVNGHSGKAFDFGGGAYVKVDGFSSVLNGNAMTITGWVKPPSSQNTYGTYFGMRDDSDDFYMLQLIGSTNVECRMNSGTAYTDTSPYPTVTANEWQFVAFVYDGAHTYCYVNSGVVTMDATGAIANSGQDFYIGSNRSGMNFDGAIDEVRAYNRALTAGEIALLRASRTIVNASKNARAATGLTGLWSFDGPDISWTGTSTGMAIDTRIASSTHDGTLAGMTRDASPTVGKIGQALKFDGATSCVTTPLSLDGLNSFTIAGWVNSPDNAHSGLFGQNDVVEFGFASGGLEGWTQGGGTVHKDLSDPNAMRTNKWHHVAFVGSKTGQSVYIDGQVAASSTGAVSDYGTSAYNFNIGGCGIWSPSGDNFNGKIDDVRTYDRNLSAAEINALFNAGK